MKLWRRQHCNKTDDVTNSSTINSSASLSLPQLFPAHHDHSHLDIVQRWAIVILHTLNYNNTEIQHMIGCSKNTVSHWIDQYADDGDVEDAYRSGRPRITDDELDMKILKYTQEKIFTSPRQIKRTLQLQVSSSTIRRRLDEFDLHGRVSQHKHQLTEDEIRSRLSFAEGYKNWTIEQWMTVWFSDEKIFTGEGFSGQQWCQRPPGETDDPKYQVNWKSHPVQINAWGCFCGRGKGYMYLYNESMDATLMKYIILTHFIPSVRLYFKSMPPEPFWLLHDNPNLFKGNVVSKCLFDNGIAKIDFPTYSPDLNLIENVWALMARRVESLQASTINALQDGVADIWENLPDDYLIKLVESMPTRCKLVIEAKGQYIHY